MPICTLARFLADFRASLWDGVRRSYGQAEHWLGKSPVVTRKLRASIRSNPPHYVRACLDQQIHQARINSHLQEVEALNGCQLSEIVFAHIAVRNYMKTERRIGMECSLNSTKKRHGTC